MLQLTRIFWTEYLVCHVPVVNTWQRGCDKICQNVLSHLNVASSFLPSPVLQYPASTSLLPSLHSELQRPAGSGCGSRCDRLILSSSGPGRPACGLGPLPGLPKPPGAPGLHLQTARSPAANHYPTDVPGILRHGQFLCASLMISALLFHFACRIFAKQVLFWGILEFRWFNLRENLCTIKLSALLKF